MKFLELKIAKTAMNRALQDKMVLSELPIMMTVLPFHNVTIKFN